jgi:LuxR family transcriptional regulator, maltose regulon positive regulatory protein
MPGKTVKATSDRRPDMKVSARRIQPSAAHAVPAPRAAPSRRISRRVIPVDVARAALLGDRLTGTFAVALVQAPAGWGKTTLLRQWTNSSRTGEVVQLSLESGDQDPAVLIGRLLHALDGAAAPTGRLLAGPLADPDFLSRVTLPRLVEYWTTRTRPTSLIFDDAHRLDGGTSWGVIGALMESARPDRMVVVSGRSTCPLRVAHLIAEQRLTRIGPHELALTADQATALLSARGATVTEADSAVLIRRTGGWPAALALLAPRLARMDNVSRLVETFSGDDPDIALYFREEVLWGLPAGLTGFLARTGSLPVLHADICDVVLGGTKSSVSLAELERRLLLRRSPTRPGEFIHHPMLSAMLEAELHVEDPQLERLGHRRAALWLSEIGSTESALAHARASGDVQLAGTLVWRAAGGMLSQGRRRVLEKWLKSFDDRELLASPALALTMAWCSLEAGRHIQPWTSAAEQGLTAPSGADDTSLRCGLKLLAAATGVGGLPGMQARGQEVFSATAADDPWRSMACYLVGSAHHLHGDSREAAAWLEEGEQLARLLSAPSVRALCLARQALLALDEGDWDLLSSLAARAIDVVRQHELAETATMVPVIVVSALALAHEGRRQEAEAAARRAARLLSYLEARLPWLTYEAKVLLGKVQLLLGDSAAARNMLAEAQSVATRTFESRHLKRMLDEEWSIAAASPLSTTLGPSALTTAELRVLQLLQTHLSFQEIGNTLFLSRNTVKTQAIAAYRKLGVRSRSEAVETGRQLGLLVTSGGNLSDI